LVRKPAPKSCGLPLGDAVGVLTRYQRDYPQGGWAKMGYSAWKPTRDTAQIREDIAKVLKQYWNYWPLGPRQVGYILIGAYGYVKSDSHFKRVGRILERGRRACLIVVTDDGDEGSWWEAIADGRTPDPLLLSTFDSPQDFYEAVRRSAEKYTTDLQEGQLVVIEIWVETASLAPQVARIAHPFGIPVYPSSGETALPVRRDMAMRAAMRAKDGIQTVILWIGDYDGMGVQIYRTMEADVSMFAFSHRAEGMVTCERLAVTPAQQQRFNLDIDPVKMVKHKDGSESSPPGPPLAYNIQAEALNPVDLEMVLTEAIDRYQDPQVRATARSRSEAERQEALDAIASLSRRHRRRS
jgi:hypothetical protein